MRQIRFILVLALLITQMSCLERKARDTDGANTSQSLEGPRIIRDTIIQTVILRDTVDNRKTEIVHREEARVVVPATQTRPTTANVSSPRSSASSAHSGYDARNDRYDRSNSGFFDSYTEGYAGDPNKDLKPTVRIVSSNVDEINRKKEIMGRELESLERQNAQQQRDQERLNQEIREYNRRAIDEAKRQQEEQIQNQRSNRPSSSTNQGKTLDTNLLLNDK